MFQNIVLSVAALQVRLCLKKSLLHGSNAQGHRSDLFSLCWESLSQPFHLSTEGRITGLLSLEGIHFSHLVQSTCSRVVNESWLSRSMYRWFLLSPGMETLQQLWPTCTYVWSPSWAYCSKICKEENTHLHHWSPHPPKCLLGFRKLDWELNQVKIWDMLKVGLLSNYLVYKVM